MGIDEDKVVPNPSLSVYEGAVAPWSGNTYGEWQRNFLRAANRFDFPVHTPYGDLTDAQKRELWDGNRHVGGIHAFFEELQKKVIQDPEPGDAGPLPGAYPLSDLPGRAAA